MANFLVTGGGGFIGSNLSEALLKRGEAVRVMDNFETGRRENLAAAGSWAREGGAGFELVEDDIRDLAACRRAMKDIDFVLHQAAIPSVPRSVKNPIATNEVNIGGTLNLLEAARGTAVKRFVHASSSSLYGESEVLPKVETMAPAPLSPYAVQKLVAEKYCNLYHELYGVPTIALRYFNVFGPRQDPDSDYAAVVPRFITALLNGERPVVYGDGEQTRDFTFVANVIDANLLSCAAGEAALGRAVNIGCGERISLNGLLRALGGLLGSDVEARYEAPRPGDVRHSLAAIDLAGELIGYRPKVALAEGLERTIKAY